MVNGVVRLVRMTGEHLDHFLARCTPYVIPPACPGRSLMQEANVPPRPHERNHESRPSARVPNGSQNATYESVCAAQFITDLDEYSSLGADDLAVRWGMHRRGDV